MRFRSAAILACISCLALAQDTNLLPNAGFEKVTKAAPTGWNAQNFRTGGVPTIETAKPHGGTRCVALQSRDATERLAWRAKVPLPKGTRFVTAAGWYRTEGVAAARQRGVTFRVHFYGKRDGRYLELALRQVFFPPSVEWAETPNKLFPVPKGSEHVELQVFNWLTPGKTYWDDVRLRPIGGKELAAMMPQLAASLGLDREPTLGRSLPYSPAERETVRTNPPPFLWLPVQAATYTLEVARNADFTGEVIRRTNLTWCAEMLTEPLATGVWHWRYGVAWENGATAWSKVRCFLVPETASPWPYPKATQFEVTKQRPRLFVAAGRLPEFRQRAENGDLKGSADAMLRDVARWAGEDIVPEPEWLPKGKARGPAYTLTFRATRPPMDKMERAGLAYLLTGDAAAGAEAKRRIRHFFAWDPHGSTNVFHNDEPAMWIMMRGSRAYDWTYDLFTPEERAKVEACMLERARDFYKKLRSMPFDNNPFESHAGRIIGFLGEAAISFAPEHEEARMWLDYITHIYWGVYPAWGKEDGGWNEGPGYWGAYMSFGLHYVTALREATGIDLSQRPFFNNTPYYRLYLTPPFSKMSPFGDGTQFKPSRPGALMYWFSTLNQDPRIRWYPDSLGQTGGNSILGVVLKDDKLESLPPFDLPLARHFEAVGLTTLHTDLTDGDENVYFAMRASPYGAVSHGHNDQNCFVLEAFGEPLAIASGHYNRYSSPHHSNWTRQTKAKCGVTIDGGKGQDRGWHARGKITDYLHGEGFDFVRGDASEAYGEHLDKAVREVVHIRPGIFVVRDELADDEEHMYEYWLHAIDEMKLDAKGGTVRIERPKASLTVKFLTPAQPKLAQTGTFDPPVLWPPGKKHQDNWHVTASQPKASKEAEFLTVLLPAKTDQEGTLPKVSRWGKGSSHGVRLAWPDGSTTLVGFAIGPTQMEGIDTDAKTFAVTRSADGGVVSWLAMRGTTLRVDGTRALRLETHRGEADDRVMISLPALISATGCFAATYGRIDVVWGPGGTSGLNVKAPDRFRVATRGTEALPISAGAMILPARLGPDSIDLWTGAPATMGEVELTLVSGDQSTVLRGLRNRRGEALVQGRLELPPGVYRTQFPAGVEVGGMQPEADGTMWLGGNERVSFRGRVPERLELTPVRQAVTLAAQPRTRIPKGQGFEAEANWREQGGAIKVSGGGHGNTSGKDNLWAWNTVGHTIEWTLDVPKAGNYELWFVGATECGMVGDLVVNQRSALALVFTPTGGWGRKRASEWRGYRVQNAPGKVAVFSLKQGRNRVALTNRSGMGLNLDRLVLVPR